jgi:glycosyltransferase involved in cell wall biosynthesis
VCFHDDAEWLPPLHRAVTGCSLHGKTSCAREAGRLIPKRPACRVDALVADRLRVCLVYDCLYPYTVGGAERWYRNLATTLVDAGHEVTYLTRRQWPQGEEPTIPGVLVVAVSRADPLYDSAGRRRIGPPVHFGAGVFGHLIRNRHRYDVVHTCSFPYFSVLSIWVATMATPTQVGVDWFEVWSDSYWREYLGGLNGRVGSAIQRACAMVTPLAFVASDRHGRRLAEIGLRGEMRAIGGLYAGGETARSPELGSTGAPLILFAGRLIPEKRAELVPAVLMEVRQHHPHARAVIVGDGPARPDIQRAITRHQASESVEMLGFVSAERLSELMASAHCLLLPSTREGYGLVVIEAAALGTPSVVVDGPDNAAVELVNPGVNGQAASADDPREIAAAVLAVLRGGPELRRSTRRWFEDNEPSLRIDQASRGVVALYEARAGLFGPSGRRAGLRQRVNRKLTRGRTNRELRACSRRDP